ncbi:uncharacterized protein LOC131432011 [Malaya genurostris]|uniref:uncharacterized protein LOC131432011 n=1 Tax=Malaya genurostris TaxID=325434 RepID=UPI0026F3D798|nr:uncharacterized protein LOC131432011 [Malaya genurostris]
MSKSEAIDGPSSIDETSTEDEINVSNETEHSSEELFDASTPSNVGNEIETPKQNVDSATFNSTIYNNVHDNDVSNRTNNFQFDRFSSVNGSGREEQRTPPESVYDIKTDDEQDEFHEKGPEDLDFMDESNCCDENTGPCGHTDPLPESEVTENNNTMDSAIVSNETGNTVSTPAPPPRPNKKIRKSKGKKSKKEEEKNHSKQTEHFESSATINPSARTNRIRMEDDETYGHVVPSRSSKNNIDPNPKAPVSSGDEMHSATEDDIGQEKEIPTVLEAAGKFSSGLEQIKFKPHLPMTGVDQLEFSALIKYEDIMIKLYNGGSLMLADNDFLAKVSFTSPRALRETTNFYQAKQVLLQQLRIEKVLQDDLSADCSSKDPLIAGVKDELKKKPTTDDQFVTNCIQLHFILTEIQANPTCGALCSAIIKNPLISDGLKQSAAKSNELVERVLARNRTLARFGFRLSNQTDPSLFETITQMLTSTYSKYKKLILKKAPANLRCAIEQLNEFEILLVRGNDLKMFADLDGALNKDVFRKPLADLAERWIANIKSTANVRNSGKLVDQFEPVYYFLCKSLNELIVEVSEKSDHKPVDLLTSNNSAGWLPIKKINWKSENSLTKCLEREYFFMFKLLKHFNQCPSGSRRQFEYEMKLLNGFSKKKRLDKVCDRHEKPSWNSKISRELS